MYRENAFGGKSKVREQKRVWIPISPSIKKIKRDEEDISIKVLSLLKNLHRASFNSRRSEINTWNICARHRARHQGKGKITIFISFRVEPSKRCLLVWRILVRRRHRRECERINLLKLSYSLTGVVNGHISTTSRNNQDMQSIILLESYNPARVQKDHDRSATWPPFLDYGSNKSDLVSCATTIKPAGIQKEST